MSSGLLALLDDVSALVKASASSLDDVSSQVSKTTGKVTGLVIDDAAVTPKYVVGLSPERELGIIWNITKKSLINKIFILGPITLLLGYFLPWLITPILMIGGSYLCLEGFHKVYDVLTKNKKQSIKQMPKISPEELEKKRTNSAIRTDMILSAEIMAITYSTVMEEALLNQIVVMLIIAIGITLGVYGAVALIVKADDFGLYLAEKKNSKFLSKTGEFIVKSMPLFLKVLSFIGTAAMLLVGFDIVVHGIHDLEVIFKKTASFRMPLIIISGLLWGGVVHLLTLFPSLFIKNMSSN